MPQFITQENHISDELKTEFLLFVDCKAKRTHGMQWETDIERLKPYIKWSSITEYEEWNVFLQHQRDKLPPVCAHDITVPEVFQDYGDREHRACWTLASKCKKCGTAFVYGSGFGLFDDLNKESS